MNKKILIITTLMALIGTTNTTQAGLFNKVKNIGRKIEQRVIRPTFNPGHYEEKEREAKAEAERKIKAEKEKAKQKLVSEKHKATEMFNREIKYLESLIVLIKSHSQSDDHITELKRALDQLKAEKKKMIKTFDDQISKL